MWAPRRVTYRSQSDADPNGLGRSGTDGTRMNLREVAAALRAGWWLLVVGCLLGGGAGLAFSLAQTPTYTATTQLFVSATTSQSASDALLGSQLSQQRVTSYARLVSGDELATRIVRRLDLNTTPAALAGEIAVTAVPDSVLLD